MKTDEKLNIYKSSKVDKNLYSAKRAKRRKSLNTSRSLNIIHHKGRWVVALTDDDWSYRTFRSCDTINRTEALQIISFLVDYINLVKPTDATALTASIKATTNRTIKVASELSAIAVNAEIESGKNE